MQTLGLILLLWTLKGVLRQAEAHTSLYSIERLLRSLPGDKTTTASPGIFRSVYRTPKMEVVSPDRLWFVLRWYASAARIAPWTAQRRFQRVPIRAASVHDLRIWLRCARCVWLSADEMAVLDQVRLRALDLRAWPDVGVGFAYDEVR